MTMHVIASTFTSVGVAPPPLVTDRAPIQLEVFDAVPAWAIVHAARDDRTAPLIKKGEVAVIEADGFSVYIPEDGGLYLIEYVTPPHCGQYGRERRTREIAQISNRSCGDQGDGWWARPYRHSEHGSREIICSDGPYRDAITLAEKILGRVIGIYQPRLA